MLKYESELGKNINQRGLKTMRSKYILLSISADKSLQSDLTTDAESPSGSQELPVPYQTILIGICL